MKTVACGKENGRPTFSRPALSALELALWLFSYSGVFYSNRLCTLRGDTASFSPAWPPFNFGHLLLSCQAQREVENDSQSWESHENINNYNLNSKLLRLSGQIQICKSQEGKWRKRAIVLKISVVHPSDPAPNTNHSPSLPCSEH